MAARGGRGKCENHMGDGESRDEELHALRRQVEKLSLLLECQDARRKQGGSRSGYSYHETDLGLSYKHRLHSSQRSKNRLWKIGTTRFQKWLEVARGACATQNELKDVEEYGLEVKEPIEFKEISNVKVNHMFHF
ncbi:hypothetical protein M0R45_026298 [Rubus argutus]|uniref:Uncharacterized protein n=1 Tax=Rubus argutus TaxID=59490 RepID=A0AAW1X0K8_RUBAR